MSLGVAITSFFNTPAGAGILAVMALSVLELALGTFAAIRDNVFQWDAVAAWVRKHLAGRVLPIVAVLVMGHLAGGLQFQEDGAAALLNPGTILTGIGLGAAALYVTEIIGSIRESLTPKPDVREVPVD
jgi:hypothetical protein